MTGAGLKKTGGWIVSTAKVVSSIVVLVTAISAFLAWSFGPVGAWLERIDSAILAQQVISETQQANTAAIADNTAAIAAIVEDMSSMRREEEARSAPAIEFATFGSSVSDGRIGGIVIHEWVFRKLRDCGRPRVAHFFINGNGAQHRFTEVSVVQNDGRGTSAPVSQDYQTLRFTARIPANDGVMATEGPRDQALAFVEIDYPDHCPSVPLTRSPSVPFNILPQREVRP